MSQLFLTIWILSTRYITLWKCFTCFIKSKIFCLHLLMKLFSNRVFCCI